MQTPAPTSSPSLAETANVAEPSPQPAETVPALDQPVSEQQIGMQVLERNGQVWLGFSQHIEAIHMTPKVARQLIRQLSQAALAADRHKPGR